MTRFKRVKDTIKPSNIIKALKDHWNRTFRLAAEKVPTFDARDKKKRSGSLFRPSRFDRNQKKRNRLLRNEGQINILERTYERITIFTRDDIYTMSLQFRVRSRARRYEIRVRKRVVERG